MQAVHSGSRETCLLRVRTRPDKERDMPAGEGESVEMVHYVVLAKPICRLRQGEGVAVPIERASIRTWQTQHESNEVI
jgi:hypothetical protein